MSAALSSNSFTTARFALWHISASDFYPRSLQSLYPMLCLSPHAVALGHSAQRRIVGTILGEGARRACQSHISVILDQSRTHASADELSPSPSRVLTFAWLLEGSKRSPCRAVSPARSCTIVTAFWYADSPDVISAAGRFENNPG